MTPPPFWSIARKDVRLIFRDRTALIFIFGLPLIFTLIFGAAFGHSDGNEKRNPLKVLVANQDEGKQGAAMVAAMRSLGLTVEEAHNANEIKDRVKSGDRPVGIVIAPDYTKQLQAAIDQITSGSAKPEQAHMQMLVDPAQSQIAGMAQGAIYAATQRASAPLFRAASLAHVPVEFRAYAEKNMSSGGSTPAVSLDIAELTSAKTGTSQPTAGDQILPGFIVYFIFFLANGVAVTLISERQEGTLRRMLSAPIKPGEILLGKMLARSYLGLLQVALLFVVGAYTLHFTLSANPIGQMLIVLACIFTATGLGLLIATMGRTQEQIQGMTTLLLLLMGFLSGCLIPRFLLPEAMQKFSLITPHAWALNAYQDILLRRLPLIATLPNLGVVLLFGAAFYGIALARFRYE